MAMPTYGYCLSEPHGKKDNISKIRRKIRAYAMLNDFEIEHIFAESELHQYKPLSKRPRGKKLLKLLNTGDVVITIKLSDVFYSAQDTLNTIQLFNNQDVNLHIIEIGGRLINENVDGSLLPLIKRFADFENSLKREKRLNAANIEHRRRGKVPFGFILQDGKLVKNPRQQSIISDMYEMHKNGMGYLAIAKKLVKKHNLTFSHMGVKKILQRNSEIVK